MVWTLNDSLPSGKSELVESFWNVVYCVPVSLSARISSVASNVVCGCSGVLPGMATSDSTILMIAMGPMETCCDWPNRKETSANQKAE